MYYILDKKKIIEHYLRFTQPILTLGQLMLFLNRFYLSGVISLDKVRHFGFPRMAILQPLALYYLNCCKSKV